MWKITLRDVRSNFKRFLMSIFAVAIAVAFLTGTLSFRDLLASTFSNLTNAVVAEGLTVNGPKSGGESAAQTFALSGDIDPAVTAEIEALDGVTAVTPQRAAMVQTFTADGVSTNLYNVPSVVYVVDLTDENNSQQKLIQGTAPELGEVVVEEATATRAGLQIGDTLIMYTDRPIEKRISGIMQFGSSVAGISIISIPEQEYTQLFGAAYQSVFVQLAADEDKSALRDQVQQIVPETYTVQTDEEIRADTEAGVDLILTMINTFLLIFVVLALGISTFIITNTFQISIRQRQKQFALLRTIGAASRQIFGALAVQAILIGIVGALLGLVFGQGLVILIRKALDAFGMPISGSVIVQPATALVALIVGIAVTLFATIIPAWRGAKTAPIEAMRDSSGQHEKSLKLRGICFSLVNIAAYAMIFSGAWKQHGIIFGVGAALAVIGLIGLMPVLIRPVVALLGWPMRKISRAMGVIASRSLTALPRKTATTATALAIGIMLVTAGSTVAASVQAEVKDKIDADVSADLIVLANGPVTDISHAAQLVEKVAGVESVDTSLRYGTAQGIAIDGKRIEPMIRFVGTSSAAALQKTGLQIIAGDAQQALERSEAIYYQSNAANSDVQVGSELTLIGSAAPVQVKVGAIAEAGNLRLTMMDLVLPEKLREELAPIQENSPLMVIDVASSAKISEVKAQIQSALKDQYIWQTMDRADLQEVASGSITTVLAILYALLALSVVIAALGVVNTLTLSVMDRKTEIGLLRAVGMQRSGVRKMILHESVLTTLLGALTGIVIGIVLGLALMRYLAENGSAYYVVPWASLGITVIAALIFGALASVLPARKAARTDVLAVIAAE